MFKLSKINETINIKNGIKLMSNLVNKNKHKIFKFYLVMMPFPMKLTKGS